MPPVNPSGLPTSRYHILACCGLLKKDLNVIASNELAETEHRKLVMWLQSLWSGIYVTVLNTNSKQIIVALLLISIWLQIKSHFYMFNKYLKGHENIIVVILPLGIHWISLFKKLRYSKQSTWRFNIDSVIFPFQNTISLRLKLNIISLQFSQRQGKCLNSIAHYYFSTSFKLVSTTLQI